MPQPTAEAIIRRRTRTGLRGVLNRLTNINRRALTGFILPAGTGFLLSFADLAGIPSGFGAAWLAACAVQGTSLLYPMLGCALSVPMRLLWGLDSRWTQLLTLVLLIPAQRMLYGRGTARMMLWTAASLLPGLAAAMIGGTQREILVSVASVALSALAAPVMYRCRRILHGEKEIGTLDEYLAVGYTSALLLCGGARMMLPGVNVGVLGASLLTLQSALLFGAGPGCMMGLISGATLALQGVPLGMGVSLAMGGFLGGLTNQSRRRSTPCACFAMASVLAICLGGPMIQGDAGAPVAAVILLLIAPDPIREQAEALGMRFARGQAPHDEYAAIQLERWEKTVEAISASMPVPQRNSAADEPSRWKMRLCPGCPEAESCTCMAEPAAAQSADNVLRALLEGAGEPALNGLRGLGCSRLYHLRSAMAHYAAGEADRQQVIRRACYERDIQTTHLSALSGAARRFAAIAPAGWWEAMQGKRLAQAASELALPARLAYIRRIDGHAQTAWRIDDAADVLAIGDALRSVTETVLKLPCDTPLQDGNILRISEKPLYRADAASVTRSKLQDASLNGDVVRMGMLREGCFFAALSDGMGHGAEARRESGQTTALLQLCLEAGYTREQALTVVNGMMLSATQGERFATVDLLTVDLWSGRMTLDKLGAANSCLVQADDLTWLSGDALPLGILEQASSRTCEARLTGGDTLLMMSDGVEDAFATQEALLEAVRAASLQPTAQQAAEWLLHAAAEASGGEQRDDQTVVAVRLIAQAASAPLQPDCPERFARRSRRVYNREKRMYNETGNKPAQDTAGEMAVGRPADADCSRDTAAGASVGSG